MLQNFHRETSKEEFISETEAYIEEWY